VAGVTETVQSVMGFTPAPEQPLMEAGLDSLGAVELKNALASRFGAELPATLTFDYPSITALAAFIASVADTAVVVQEVAGSLAGSWSSEVRGHWFLVWCSLHSRSKQGMKKSGVVLPQNHKTFNCKKILGGFAKCAC
jgi:acyl carrier protein